MAEISLSNLAHSYTPQPKSPDDYALKPGNYLWKNGGAYALLGPSGCGKTTLLNIMSGLLTPSQGQVLFDGVDVTRQSTAARNIAQVFQFPVIYDSMTVFDNLAFPLRNRKLPAGDVKLRVHEVAEMLDLLGDLPKKARGLSADAKQTISLGRALVRNDVAAILFDEPLTVIDPHLKFVLRRKLKQIHQRYKLTLIYVTHDQSEALTFADTVVVMSEGEVVQVGTPQELFEKPSHTFVGHFIGSPGMNFLPCRIERGMVVVDDVTVSIDTQLANQVSNSDGSLQLGVRPEFLQLSATENLQPGGQAIEVNVQQVEDLGNFKIATANLGKHLLKIKVDEESRIAPGKGHVTFPSDLTLLYENEYLVGPVSVAHKS